MAVSEIDARDLQGRVVDVDSDGTIITFGPVISKCIIANPATNAHRVYFSWGEASLTVPATKTDAEWEVLFPFLASGENISLVNDKIKVTSLHLRCATGKSATGFRVILC